MTHTMFADPEAPAEEAASLAVGADVPAMFKSVLVGVDGTSTGRDAIALGEKLCDTDGRLTLAHVVLVQGPGCGNFHSTGAGRTSRAMLERERETTEVAAELTGMFAPSIGWGLDRLARDIGADLVVVGSCARRPLGRLLRGDSTRRTRSRATCAVAVTPPSYAERPNSIDTIGVAYDGSPESERALIAARALAAQHGAALHAATAVWPTTATPVTARHLPLAGARWAMMLDTYERDASERLRALTGVNGRVLIGPPADELLEFGDDVDLLVVGSRGHGALRRLLLGSTSTYLARNARCPLLVLPRSRQHHTGPANAQRRVAGLREPA